MPDKCRYPKDSAPCRSNRMQGSIPFLLHVSDCYFFLVIYLRVTNMKGTRPSTVYPSLWLIQHSRKNNLIYWLGSGTWSLMARYLRMNGILAMVSTAIVIHDTQTFCLVKWIPPYMHGGCFVITSADFESRIQGNLSGFQDGEKDLGSGGLAVPWTCIPEIIAKFYMVTLLN